MTSASQASDYNLDLELGRQDEHPIDYTPEPPLDIDTRPIDGESLRRWRKMQPPSGDKPVNNTVDYATIRTTAERLGVSPTFWQKREKQGASSPCWSALIREWIVSDGELAVEMAPAPLGQVRALVELLGGTGALGEALGVPTTRIEQWSKDLGAVDGKKSGAPVSGGAGPLIRWLFEEFGLEEVERVDRCKTSGRAQLEPHQVREIRRRGDDGEAIVDIAEDFPSVSYQVVYSAARRQTYQYVDGGSE
jgi:hypothetical protein